MVGLDRQLNNSYGRVQQIVDVYPIQVVNTTRGSATDGAERIFQDEFRVIERVEVAASMIVAFGFVTVNTSTAAFM